MRFPTGGIVRESPYRGSTRLDSGTDSKVWMGEELALLYVLYAPEDIQELFYSHSILVLCVDWLFVCTFTYFGRKYI